MPTRSPIHRPSYWRPYQDTRPTARARGYDSNWERARAEALRRHPLCSEPGCNERATDVDHILTINERPDLRLTQSNLRPLCHSHHSRKTTTVDQGRGKHGGFGSARLSGVSRVNIKTCAYVG